MAPNSSNEVCPICAISLGDLMSLQCDGKCDQWFHKDVINRVCCICQWQEKKWYCNRNDCVKPEDKPMGFMKKEMAHFTKMTTLCSESGKHNAVIMGRKTWESIPEKFRPLKGRTNIVLSRSKNVKHSPDVVLCSSFQESLEALNKPPLAETIGNVWIIGGSSVYEEAMRNNQCHRIYVTWIKKDFDCDTFFPKIPENFEEAVDDNVPLGIQEENGIQYEYKVYERKAQPT